MTILYLGDATEGTSSRHRADALRRLGHDVRVVGTEFPDQARWLRWLHYRTGYTVESSFLERRVLKEIDGISFDLVWVDNGARVSRRLLRKLTKQGAPAVNYNLDDATGNRDGRRWLTFRRALPAYDLAIVVRHENVAEYQKLGAKRILRVFRSYDPVAHAPLCLTDEDLRRWGADVVFVGAWMPERGPFMLRLIELGLPLSIRGDHWQKAPEWRKLRPYVASRAVYGVDYVKAIQSAKVCLGLLSKGNRDLHTQRSAEIPFIGGLFCGERTAEHETMFVDGREAVFWSSPEDCVAVARELVNDEKRRRAIAAAGRVRIVANGASNDEVLRRALVVALDPSEQQSNARSRALTA